MTSDPAPWRLDDAAAEYFEAHFVPAIFAAWAPILADAARVQPGQHVLDVACGTGVVARAVADRLGGRGRVTGLDLNASMLAVARRLRPEIDWHEGDVGAMPFADASFDVVLSQAALMFFPDRVAALREMGRVLRPGGTLVVHVFGASPGYAAAAAALEAVAGRELAEIFRAPFVLAEPGRVRELLTAAGFAAAALQTHERAARYPSVDALVRTEVDGWVLRGRVDVDALLPGMRSALAPWVGAGGEVAIPMAGHVFTCSKG